MPEKKSFMKKNLMKALEQYDILKEKTG